MATSPRTPAFPIIHWDRPFSAISPASVDTEHGTAFFVTSTGLFLTAKHVVRDCSPEKPYVILLIDEANANFSRVQVTHISLHPVLDAAVGFARVSAPVPKFRLGTGRLRRGDLIVTFGYSNTQHSEIPSVGEQGKSLILNFRPDFYRGTIEDYYPDGHSIAKGWPVYRHDADILGGISGGPLVHLADSAVYGINCTGFEKYGTATAIDALLDWPIDFLRGVSLRDFASERPDLLTLESART